VVVDQAELTSIEILRGLAEYEIDAAISYVENEPLKGVVAQPLYAERYIFVTPKTALLGNRETVAWSEIGEAPLCLLRRDMQNRRIIDAIMPERYARFLGSIAHLSYAKLVDPVVTNAIGLLVPQRDPLPALVSAFRVHVSSVSEAEAAAR